MARKLLGSVRNVTLALLGDLTSGNFFRFSFKEGQSYSVPELIQRGAEISVVPFTDESPERRVAILQGNLRSYVGRPVYAGADDREHFLPRKLLGYEIISGPHPAGW